MTAGTKKNPRTMACLGAATRQVRTTEHMEQCRACGTEVQFQLVDHRFFGFKAGCDRWSTFQQGGVTDEGKRRPVLKAD